MNIVDITEIENLIHGKSFEEVKQIAQNSNIRVRELNSSDQNVNNLYLLISDDSDKLTPLQIQCNGIILEKESNKVIGMCQNKFININDFTFDHMNQLLTNSKKFRMEYCEDGTLIRLYNYNGSWLTATTKCIDAKYSYWSSDKTFDDMFWEIAQNNLLTHETLNMMDPDYTYIFILLHKENRIVVNHKHNKLIYVSRINNNDKKEDYTNYFYNENQQYSMRKTKKIDVENHNNVKFPLDDYFLPSKRGILVKVSNGTSWTIYHYDFNTYSKIKQVRGNVPLIRMRYLELLNDPEALKILEENYSEYIMLFTLIRHQLTNLYKQIHKLYFESHIKHNITVNEDHPLYRTLKQLHAYYKNTGNQITLDEVKNKVNTLDSFVLKKFLDWV